MEDRVGGLTPPAPPGGAWPLGGGRRRRHPGRLVAIGGTVRNLASAVQKRMDLPDVDEQGFVLTRDALEELIELLADRPASERGAVPGIKPDRGDVILGGALVVAAAMEHGGFDELEVAEAGLREGVFFEHLLADRSARRCSTDVRTASVENLSRRFAHRPCRTSPTSRSSRWSCSTRCARPACTTSATATASCCGRPECCTTSA